VKFLLDVCVSSRSLQEYLAGDGHDVASALSVDPKASDERLIEIALREDCLLVTEDKDFGELIFVHRLPHGPIVRLVELTVDEQVAAMAELLARHGTELTGSVLVTVARGRIRIRRPT
jgi:predicted nuclease of predicted toxin-antitoxin system